MSVDRRVLFARGSTALRRRTVAWNAPRPAPLGGGGGVGLLRIPCLFVVVFRWTDGGPVAFDGF